MTVIYDYVIILSHTHIHGLLWGVSGNPVEHDTGQHGAKQYWEAARDTLHTGETTAGGPTDHRVPDVTVTEVRRCFHEE